MKKIFAIILMSISVLLVSNFASIGNTLPQETVTNKVASAGIMAPPSLFPTNATFETKAEVIGNETVNSVGGLGTDYYAQSFKALSDYIVNGGLWIEHDSGMTPNFRLMLCNSTASDQPNVANPMYTSQVISNTTIYARPGRFYLNLTSPMRVQQNRTYWLVIDGYYDHTTVGTGRSKWRTGNPYSDGYFTFSNDAGVTWNNMYPNYDLNFVANFTNRPNKTEDFGTTLTYSVGGTSGSDYYAQSFKALDSYVVDAGIWIQNYTKSTPDFRVQIWGNNASSGHPDKNVVIASSRVIKGNEINATMGQRFFVHPNVSIPVVAGETYWLVIDGYYDQTTAGSAATLGDTVNIYKDGQLMYSNNAGSTWNTWTTADLNFIVTFSASQSAIKMMKGGSLWTGIGGTGVWNYAGQSFKALNKYILNAGVWLENYSLACPSIRLLICPTAALNASQPDINNPIAVSIPITSQEISTNPRMIYLNPTKPITVVPGQTYYFIIDGYYDHTTAGYLKTYDRSDNPYKDGYELASGNIGATWTAFNGQYDLGLDMTFSDVPYEAQCGQNMAVGNVGGFIGSDYYAQSFVALNDYLVDAGIWMENASTIMPSFRMLLCSNNVDQPNINDVLAASMAINGTTISANPDIFYLKPTTPIPVEIGQTYWIVIDGYYDHTTNGHAMSRGYTSDAYPDGQFMYSNDVGVTWYTYAAKDLEFAAVFTHVNQPPTQPPVLISPLKPLDSDDLYAYMSYGSTDLEQEPIAYYVEWYKNGVPQPAWANTNTLPNSVTAVTDDWMVKITPYDGHINGTAGIYTVHIQADIGTIDHPVKIFSQTFHVFTTSNTTITGFAFNNITSKITFTSTGPAGTKGFCNITIPRDFMDAPWIIKVNSVDVPTPLITQNSIHTIIYLNYSTSSVPIEIQGSIVVPEFTPIMLLITFAITTLAVAVVSKKINKRKQ